jgi:hypothetical protein
MTRAAIFLRGQLHLSSEPDVRRGGADQQVNRGQFQNKFVFAFVPITQCLGLLCEIEPDRPGFARLQMDTLEIHKLFDRPNDRDAGAQLRRAVHRQALGLRAGRSSISHSPVYCSPP